MSSTSASAPAKIILFGEHFAVYNQPIILASINKRMKIECKIEREKNKTVNIETNHFGKKIYPLSILEKNNHNIANDFVNYDAERIQPLSLDGSEGRTLQFELVQSLVRSYAAAGWLKAQARIGAMPSEPAFCPQSIARQEKHSAVI